MTADIAASNSENKSWHTPDGKKSVSTLGSDSLVGTASVFCRALITGGGGFVGGYLRAALEEMLAGADIICTTRKATSVNTGSWFTVDLTDCSTVNALAQEYRPDLVVHLAAQSSLGLPAGANSETWKVNVGGAITLAEALASFAPNATILNVSSAEVYGQSFLNGQITENTELRPISVYGRTKVAAEAVFDDILPDTARLITVRPFNHTGPGQDERFVVPSLAAQIARIERGEQAPPLRVGNLDSERDFLDVRDVVYAYARLIEHSQTLPMRSVFNIASGRPVRISEILSQLQAMANRGISIEQDPARMRVSDIPCAVGDASAIRIATGWAPVIGLDQTLRDVLEGMR